MIGLTTSGARSPLRAVLGGYLLGAPVATGAMGSVYRAKDSGGQPVAARPGDQRSRARGFLEMSGVSSGGRTAVNANTFHQQLPCALWAVPATRLS